MIIGNSKTHTNDSIHDLKRAINTNAPECDINYFKFNS